jgi:hypothetical protein
LRNNFMNPEQPHQNKAAMLFASAKNAQHLEGNTYILCKQPPAPGMAAGLYVVGHDENINEKDPLWVCAPLCVLPTPSQTTRYLEWRDDSRKAIARMAIPVNYLSANNQYKFDAVMQELAEGGLEISDRLGAKVFLWTYIRGWNVPIYSAILPTYEFSIASELGDAWIDEIADFVVKGMPEGIRGFMREWGWRQFARALLDACKAPGQSGSELATDELETTNETLLHALRIASLALTHAAETSPNVTPAYNKIAQVLRSHQQVLLSQLHDGTPTVPPMTGTGRKKLNELMADCWVVDGYSISRTVDGVIKHGLVTRWGKVLWWHGNEEADADNTAPAKVQPMAHPDDAAVDQFAALLKSKLAKAREKGCNGWSDPAWPAAEINRQLHEHAVKGDPLDVAAYAMFLALRGEATTGAQLHADVLKAPSFKCSACLAVVTTWCPGDHSGCPNDFRAIRAAVQVINQEGGAA